MSIFANSLVIPLDTCSRRFLLPTKWFLDGGFNLCLVIFTPKYLGKYSNLTKIVSKVVDWCFCFSCR